MVVAVWGEQPKQAQIRYAARVLDRRGPADRLVRALRDVSPSAITGWMLATWVGVSIRVLRHRCRRNRMGRRCGVMRGTQALAAVQYAGPLSWADPGITQNSDDLPGPFVV